MEDEVKPPLYRSRTPIIDRHFEDAAWFNAITWQFKHWQPSRFSDGSHGVWYGSESVERAVEHEPLHRQIASVLPPLPVTDKIAILPVMKSVTALEAKNRFGEVLEAAQRQPVSITRNGRPSVVMISAESYARRQRMARERLRQAMRQAGEHAAAQGMSEQVLGQLLADDS